MRLQNAATALFALMAILLPVAQAAKEKNFVRVASFPIFKNTNVNKESVSEIVTATQDGNTLIYTDSSQELLGFVDIRDENNPLAAGTVKLPGEPTSVSVVGQWAIVCVNTSEDFVNTSGVMIVIHIGTQKIVRRMKLGGQPDAIAVSPNGNYAAIAIENERDEDLGEGEPPQAPAGFVVCLKTRGHPSRWTMKTVEMTGFDGLYPDDPEPEFVDVDKRDWAVVTMQENNHLALVNLRTCKMVRDFSAGTVDLDQVDTEENEKIEPDSQLKDVPREPDAVTWVSQDPYLFATANEGDLNGGSRGFSIFNSQGKVMFDSGNEVEHITMSLGHYPEDRSENKGSEPESIEFGVFGKDELLFVGAERASVVLVYDISSKRKPEYKQTLPTGLGPEGMIAIPKRDIFVVASENDSRDDGFRSYLTIYKRITGPPTYPTIMSADKEDGTPITWGALSTLTAHPFDSSVMYTAHDNFYVESTIYKVKVGSPAMITEHC
jgi:DNA-binding beta-propeller fold protein YncE